MFFAVTSPRGQIFGNEFFPEVMENKLKFFHLVTFLISWYVRCRNGFTAVLKFISILVTVANSWDYYDFLSYGRRLSLGIILWFLTRMYRRCSCTTQEIETLNILKNRSIWKKYYIEYVCTVIIQNNHSNRKFTNYCWKWYSYRPIGANSWNFKFYVSIINIYVIRNRLVWIENQTNLRKKHIKI